VGNDRSSPGHHHRLSIALRIALVCTPPTVALVYRDGYLSDDHLCSSFAYYIDEASKNSEVQKYLVD